MQMRQILIHDRWREELHIAITGTNF